MIDRYPNLTAAQALLNLTADFTLDWATVVDAEGRTVWRAVCDDGSRYDIGRPGPDYDWWLVWVRDEWDRTVITLQPDLLGLRARAQRHCNARCRLDAWTAYMLSHDPPASP